MKDFNRIGEDLFNKLRGRFHGMTIGDENGSVTNEPQDARFFDFEYSESGAKLGKVSVSISEDDGLTVIYSRDFIQNEDEMTQKNWYNFLRELRKFSKKRLLNFDVRDINKSNLTKRDYKFLAMNRPEDINMNESKMYGTGRVSYQNVDSARLVVKHTENIDQTIPSSRTRKIGSIYIESSEGERFKYPYRHMSGARAMARHVAEGGNPYDDFGSHIIGLSEEMSKLRKFKNYMGRSAVMAESLADYMDIVKERISTVKKTIEGLQKQSYYQEAFSSFEKPMMEDVPEDVAENWIDELTIKQFNEELKDVFPYIYNLVKEGTKAKALGPDDLLGEAANDCDETCPKSCPDCGGTGDPEKYKKDKEVEEAHGNSKVYDKCWDGYKKVPGKKRGEKGSCVKEEDELEELFNQSMGQFAETDLEENNFTPDDIKKLERMPVEKAKEYAKALIQNKGPKQMKMNKMSYFSRAIEKQRDTLGVVKLMYDLLLGGEGMRTIGSRYSTDKNWYSKTFDSEKRDLDKDGDVDSDDYMKAKDIAIKKAMGKDNKEVKEKKTPLGEFILSYFDYTTGQFPKGETAILTMVEKDYGEEFIEPAKAFIGRVNERVAEVMGFRQEPEIQELDDISRLAGL